MTARKPCRDLAMLLMASLLVACCSIERPARICLSGCRLKDVHLQNSDVAASREPGGKTRWY